MENLFFNKRFISSQFEREHEKREHQTDIARGA